MPSPINADQAQKNIQPSSSRNLNTESLFPIEGKPARSNPIQSFPTTQYQTHMNSYDIIGVIDEMEEAESSSRYLLSCETELLSAVPCQHG